jgi:glycine/D-amino acid oxidase-like deaminating enzyme
MNLRSHYPYWLLKQGIIRSYPSLEKNIDSEVVIMGAGITGALVAWELCRAGIKTIVVDRRHVGMGSTAACTALLQYEIDTPLHALIKKIGYRNAVRSYQLCLQSIYDLKKICDRFYDKAGYRLRPSFQFASYKKHTKELEQEYKLRKNEGIRVSLLDGKDVANRYGFKAPVGLLSHDGAEVDAYNLTHTLLYRSKARGLRVFDHSAIKKINFNRHNVELLTDADYIIKARKLVIACGYESQKYLPKKIEKLSSTYAIVSEPLPMKHFWYRNSLIWETASPYLYMRTTSDHRILVGGKDDPFSDPLKRDQAVPGKAKTLSKAFCRLFPNIPIKIDFQWGGVFGSTKDGLPYIGSIPQRPNTFFALGYGGNGVTFSLIAAQLIRDLLKGHKNPDLGIFSFDR